MNDDHTRWRRLVLAMDDLEGEYRAAAQAHLGTCAECASLLQRVREHERAPAQLGAWGAAAFHAAEAAELSASTKVPSAEGPLTLEERAQADASLARLLSRGQGPSAGAVSAAPRTAAGQRTATARRRVVRRWIGWGVPLAAAATVVLMLRSPASGPLAPDSLQLVTPGVQRGEEHPRALDAWRTGDPFALRFELRAPGFPMVFHVDPSLRVAQLHPPPGGPLPQQPTPAGTVVVPDPQQGERWVLEGEPGSETFLVAASAEPPRALGQLLERAQRVGGQAGTRTAMLEALRELLASEVGPVQTVELSHRP